MRDLADVINDLGFGRAQIRQLIMGGGVYSADGAEMLIIGAVTRVLGQEWSLSASQKGSIVTCVFVGVMVGNILGGWLGDTYGRRSSIMLSLAGVAAFSVLSAASRSYISLCMTRTFVGAAMGTGIPAWNSLSGEIVPGKWRMMCNGLSMGFFTAGEIYAGLLLLIQDPALKQIHWRCVVIMGAVPAFILSVAAFFGLYESPVFLAAKGEQRKMLEILESLRELNGRRHVDISNIKMENVEDDKIEMMNFSSTISLAYVQQFLYITLAMCYSGFVLNFLFYGGLYAFPQIFADLETTHSAATNLIVGALWEFPGLALAILVGTYYGRKPSMLASIFVNALALACFGWAGHAHGNKSPSEDSHHTWAGTETVLHVAYYGIKCSTEYTFILFYVYASEVYPAESRAKGTAVFLAFSRVGSMIAPIVYEHLFDAFHTFKAFFYLSSVLCVVNLFCIYRLPETFGKRSQSHISRELSGRISFASDQLELAEIAIPEELGKGPGRGEVGEEKDTVKQDDVKET